MTRRPDDSTALYQLSRFAVLRVTDDGFVLESPLNNKQFPVRGASIMRILDALSHPVRLESLLASVGEPEREALRSFFKTCEEAKLLTRLRDDGLTEEQVGPLGYWEFHDLLFHASTRMGRNRRPVGGTYRLKDRLPPEPAFRPDEVGESLILPKPDPGQIQMSWTQVMERRRSQYGEGPLTLNALGSFLYWTCRTTRVIEHGDEAMVQKLYPSGGSLHSLSAYVAIRACDGCTPGLYRYLDREHALRPVSTSPAVEKLLTDAASSTGGHVQNPAVLLILSARFPRTAWKYESIAYRLILLEIGALLQTMYLAATGLNLRGCALGCGDSDHFARIAGTDYYSETSVGEFLLGA
ncbi:MAG TPA: SagB family peptide dehydrogenase [Candidatus Angelobacter sp.]